MDIEVTTDQAGNTIVGGLIKLLPHGDRGNQRIVHGPDLPRRQAVQGMTRPLGLESRCGQTKCQSNRDQSHDLPFQEPS